MAPGALYRFGLSGFIGEEFGFSGLLLLLVLFYALIYFSFQVTAVSHRPLRQLLSAGITVYLAHAYVGEYRDDERLVAYHRCSLGISQLWRIFDFVSMTALGILQEVSVGRRYMF